MLPTTPSRPGEAVVNTMTNRIGQGAAERAQSAPNFHKESCMRLPLAASTLAIALALAACSPQPEGAATPAAATQQAEDQSAANSRSRI